VTWKGHISYLKVKPIKGQYLGNVVHRLIACPTQSV